MGKTEKEGKTEEEGTISGEKRGGRRDGKRKEIFGGGAN